MTLQCAFVAKSVLRVELGITAFITLAAPQVRLILLPRKLTLSNNIFLRCFLCLFLCTPILIQLLVLIAVSLHLTCQSISYYLP